MSATRHTYIIKALGRDHEILAWDEEDAYRTVSRMLQRQHPMPTDDGQTYWLPCRMYDAQTGRLLQAWSEPISWPGELTDEYATSTYYLVIDSFDTEFIASDDAEAMKRGRALLREICGPNRGFETRYVEARIENGDGAILDAWTEALEGEIPGCDAPIPELADAPSKELGRLLGYDVRDDGHVWAPFTDSEAICLRCGTGRTAEGYDPGRYAAVVADIWRIAHP